MRQLRKLTASDGKGIVTNLYQLPDSIVSSQDHNHPHTLSDLRLNYVNDMILEEALNSITTVSVQRSPTGFYIPPCRYLWKLKYENTASIRQYLLRLTSPIGLFFFVRNSNSPTIYRFLNYGQEVSLRSRFSKIDFEPRILNNQWVLSSSMWSMFIEPVLNTYILHESNREKAYYETLTKFNDLLVGS